MPNHGALTARAPGTAAANEPVRGKGTQTSAEPHAHRFDRVHVVFRDDGSALLEYSEAPPGESLVDESTAGAATRGSALPTPIGRPEDAAQLPLPLLTSEPPMATEAPPPAGQWAAGPASMTAFAVGAAVATLVLVSGYLVYRSLAPSDAPTMAARPPPTATFEGAVDTRASVRPGLGRVPPPAAGVTPIAPPVATTQGRREPTAPINGSGRPAASPTPRPSVAAPAPRSAEAPPPPLDVPCTAAVAALGLCTPTEPGRP